MTRSDTTSSIPVIDFSLFESEEQRKECADRVFNAARDVGFFYLRNFGIDRISVQSMFDLSKTFFALSKEEKEKYAIQRENIGYSAIRQEATDPENHSQGDHKESFHVAKFKDNVPSQQLPPVFSAEQKQLGAFVKACHDLTTKILMCLAIGLEIPESEGGSRWFADRHAYDTPSGDVLRLLHYPALDNENASADDVRIGRHSDYGSITLLFQHGVAGLQIQANREATKMDEIRWMDAPVLDDCVVVNLGDCLEYWTNNVLRSTKHRVIFRPDTQSMPRYSMAYFCQGGPIELVPVPSRLVPERTTDATTVMTASEHLKRKLSETYSSY